MRTFAYQGFDAVGKTCKGMIEASDRKEAREKLSARGILAESVSPASDADPSSSRRISRDDRATLYRELGSLLKAGMTVTDGLDMLMQAPGRNAASRVMASARDRVREGAPVADALKDGGLPIGEYEQAVLTSGERAGDLPGVLENLADYLDTESQVRQRITSALLYPCLIIGLALVIAAAVLGFLVPRISRLLVDSGMELPVLTRILLVSGRLFVPVLLVMLAGSVLATWWLRRVWREKEITRERVEQVVMGSPLAGRPVRLIACVRFAGTMAMLLRSGMPLVEAMGLAGASSGFRRLERRCREEAEKIRHGKSFSDAVQSIPLLAEELQGWVRAGEAGGDLPGMLAQAAERGRRQWMVMVDRRTKLIEPALLLMVGLFVLLVALGILLPILSLNTNIG